MSTRQIKDAVDTKTNEKIYIRSHAMATYMSDGRNVEDAINAVGSGGGDNIVIEQVSSTEPTAEFPQVLYVAQSLTESEKQQARKNIGADDNVEILSNGNIKVTINGVSNYFMPSTPSGDPMHYYYESLGAQWNDSDEDVTLQIPIYGKDFNTTEYFPVVHKSKRWYLNLLGNITNKQMAEIVSYPRTLFGNYVYVACKARTIVYEGTGLGAAVSFDGFGNGSAIESIYASTAMYPSSTTNMFYSGAAIKYLLGAPSNRGYFIGYEGINSSWSGCFKHLIEIRIYSTKKNVLLQDSPNLSKTSVLFMINEATPKTAVTIKLHATAYARVANDEEVIAALEAKNAALQGTGGSVSIVSA